MTENICNCDEFKAACKSGSTYGRADDIDESDPAIECDHIGNIDVCIKFCPWCGKKVPEQKDGEQ